MRAKLTPPRAISMPTNLSAASADARTGHRRWRDRDWAGMLHTAVQFLDRVFTAASPIFNRSAARDENHDRSRKPCRSLTASTMYLAIAIDEVAPGEGAFRT